MREGMLCGMWEGPLGHLSGTWSSTSLLSSGPVQFCMLVVGVRGCRLSWVGGGKNRDGMLALVVDSHAKDAGGTFATDQEAC